MTNIHFLLTYTCNFECDHCFLYCGPKSEGTFTIKQIKDVLNEARKIGSEAIYFEGGEPFLYYPIMLEGLKIAKEMGFKTGIVTNAYWATSVEDAELWIKPIAKLDVSDFSVSDDSFHHEDKKESPAKIALKAATKLGIAEHSICIESPTLVNNNVEEREKGAPVIGGGAMFRGRAVEKLIKGLPTREWHSLNTCPYEELKDPERVHVDSFGNVHICQGISIGNMFETSLSKLLQNYDVENHPICKHLYHGGPAELAKKLSLQHEDEYVDECHFCYLMRLTLLDKYPEYLTPKQVYGL